MARSFGCGFYIFVRVKKFIGDLESSIPTYVSMKFGDYSFSKKFKWLNDNFGVS